MKPEKGMRFNQFRIDGWRCRCGEAYFNPEQAQRILLLNKLRKQKFRLRLSQVRSNLILRIPKEVGEVLDLHKGEEVEFSLNDSDRIIINAVKA
jgi:hypothetical protein